jgi:heme exporter protein D
LALRQSFWQSYVVTDIVLVAKAGNIVRQSAAKLFANAQGTKCVTTATQTILIVKSVSKKRKYNLRNGVADA